MTTETDTFKEGDLVTPRADLFSGSVPSGVFAITKVPSGAREVNYIAKPYNTETKEVVENGRGLRAPAYAFSRYNPMQPVMATFDFPPADGTIIKLNAGMLRQADPKAYYVVLGPSRKGGVKVTLLGGDPTGRYYPHVPLAAITEVPLTEVLGE